MVLSIVGLGLGDERDITLRGLDCVRAADEVWLEAYTSILGVDTAALEALYGKEVKLADRERVEQGIDEVLRAALEKRVAFLVVGDPFGATTHTDLQVRARELGVEVEVVHNASVMNAVAACGLHLYRFGQTVSVVFFTDTWRPDSFYDYIAQNAALGLHTLALLDIRVKEPSVEALCRGRKEYEPPRYMSCAVAAQQLLEVEESKKGGVCTPEALCVGVARLGQPSQAIVACTLGEMAEQDLGPPLHSLVIAGSLHPMEEEALKPFRLGAGR